MNNKLQITYVATSDLSIYKSTVPEWDQEEPEFLALADDIRGRGVDVPLICFGNRVVDGRARWRAAKRYQIKQVPTVTCDESEIATIIVRSLLNRRHLTKGALAYVAFPLMAQALEESKKRRLQNLNNIDIDSPLSGRSMSSARTVDELAGEIGISRALFFQAKELYEKFAKQPELREQFEPGILSGETGLGAAIAGIAGQESTKGKERVDDSQLQLFNDGVTTMGKRFTYWSKFDQDQRELAIKAIRKTVESMPDDLLGEFERAIRAAKRAKEEAK